MKKMNNTVAEKVCTTSIKLDKLLSELEKCKQEKANILLWADEQKKLGTLEKNIEILKKRTDESIAHYEKVNSKIKKLRQSI